MDIIARGAFGNVIQVRSIHDKQVYAMKIMSKSQIVKDNAVQQVKGTSCDSLLSEIDQRLALLDEVTIAQSCQLHPFIVHKR